MRTRWRLGCNASGRLSLPAPFYILTAFSAQPARTGFRDCMLLAAFLWLPGFVPRDSPGYCATQNKDMNRRTLYVTRFCRAFGRGAARRRRGYCCGAACLRLAGILAPLRKPAADWAYTLPCTLRVSAAALVTGAPRTLRCCGWRVAAASSTSLAILFPGDAWLTVGLTHCLFWLLPAFTDVNVRDVLACGGQDGSRHGLAW